VKNTDPRRDFIYATVEYTDQNGVNHPRKKVISLGGETVEEIIKDGVKETELHKGVRPSSVEDVIQNGVKETIGTLRRTSEWGVDDIIQNGVKNTYSDKVPNEYDWSDEFTKEVEDTIQNGVKHTFPLIIEKSDAVRDIIQEGMKVKDTFKGNFKQAFMVNEVINDGVKDIKPKI
jgi:tartrate dehydratase alpha subunit/fumarate hydratase class I-like protein